MHSPNTIQLRDSMLQIRLVIIYYHFSTKAWLFIYFVLEKDIKKPHIVIVYIFVTPLVYQIKEKSELYYLLTKEKQNNNKEKWRKNQNNYFDKIKIIYKAHFHQS